MGIHTHLAWRLMKRGDGGGLHPRVRNGIFSVALGVALPVFVLALYDSAVFGNERTQQALFPEMSLRAVGEDGMGVSTAWSTRLAAVVAEVLPGASLAPVIHEAGDLHLSTAPEQEPQRVALHLIGASKCESGLMPTLDSIIDEAALTALDHVEKTTALLGADLFQHLFPHGAVGEPVVFVDLFPQRTPATPEREPGRFAKVYVVGVIEVRPGEATRGLLVTSFSNAQMLTGREGRATGFGIYSPHHGAARGALPELRRRLDPLQVEVMLGSQIGGPQMQQTANLKRLFPGVLSAVLLICGVQIHMGLMGLIEARRRTLGLLGAMGLRTLDIGRVFVRIGLVQACLGCGLGLFTGLALGYWFISGLAAMGVGGSLGGPSFWANPTFHLLLIGAVIGGCIPAAGLAVKRTMNGQALSRMIVSEA